MIILIIDNIIILLCLVGADYSAVVEILTFNTATSGACFVTSTEDDGLLEENEKYIIILTLISNQSGVIFDPTKATVTIIDDDHRECTSKIRSF